MNTCNLSQVANILLCNFI